MVDKENQSHVLEHDALIGLIYEAVLTPSLWPKLLHQMGSYLDAAPVHSDAESQCERGLLYHSLELHFKRAARITDKVTGLESVVSAFSEVMDRLPVGVLLVHCDASVLMCNKVASALLASTKHLSIQQGRLQASAPTKNKKLHVMIQQAQDTEDDTSMFMSASENDDIALWVTGSSPSLSNIHTIESLVVVFVNSFKTQRNIPLGEFSDRYQLSQAETKLARSMLDCCHTLNEAADYLSVSKHTVRSQMKAIFAKTGVSSQIELMKKIWGSRFILTRELPAYEKVGSIQDHHGCEYDASQMAMYLQDGRRLSWHEYGDLSGLPVMLFHSLTGAHLDYKTADKMGIRLIVPNRPGMGSSDVLHGRSFIDWAEDIRQLANYLGLDSFSLIGYSAGTPYVLACASHMPKRVKHISLISCMAPVRSIEDLSGMLPLNHTAMRFGHTAPELLAEFMTVLLNDLKDDAMSYFDYVKKYQPEKDIIALDYHTVQENLLQAFQKAAKENFQQLCDEIILCASNWSFDIEVYKGSASIWHGENDPLVPISMGKRIANALTDPDEYYFQKEGNYLIYTHWKEILSSCIGEIRVSA